MSSLIESQLPSEADADSQDVWEDVTQPLEDEAVEATALFNPIDIPTRQESGERDMDCSSVQNSPRSNSSVHDMSLDEYEQ